MLCSLYGHNITKKNFFFSYIALYGIYECKYSNREYHHKWINEKNLKSSKDLTIARRSKLLYCGMLYFVYIVMVSIDQCLYEYEISNKYKYKIYKTYKALISTLILVSIKLKRL